MKKVNVCGTRWSVSAKMILCSLMILLIGMALSAASLAEGLRKERAFEMHFADYEDLYFSILDLTDGPNYDEEFDSLPDPVQVMHILAIFDMEIGNGGLVQFFSNCGSAYAMGVADDLRTVGLEEIAVAYESYLSKHHIMPDALSAFEVGSIADFSELYEKYPFDDFDDSYMDLREVFDFDGRMIFFAEEHPEVFVRVQ